MKPAKMLEESQDQPKRVIINGPRPFPLSINKVSQRIQKPSSSSYLTNVSGQLAAAPVARKQQNPRSTAQQRRPVIIYTHSPKIIHAEARDFMALVQKLTGLSRSDDHDQEENNATEEQKQDSSSDVTAERCGDAPDDVKESSSFVSVSPTSKTPSANFADFPLFTPNSSHFLVSPNVLSSPSFLEFMKGLQEY